MQGLFGYWYNRRMSYNNPIPVAVALVFNEDHSKVLVGERTIEPFIGGTALIGGYVDAGETPEKATKREVLEEVGCSIENANLSYESSAITPNNRLLMFFSTAVPEMLFEAAQDSTEMRNVRFVEPQDILSQPLCFPLHQEALVKAWSKHRPDLFPINVPVPI